MFIEPQLLIKLERMRIPSKKLFIGNMKGKRRSPKRGSSIEFADYRDYQPGDDFRFIDWNIYSRLDKLFTKTFMEEENIFMHILIDTSESMKSGTPPKLLFAKQVAFALSYISLVNLDIVMISGFNEDISKLPPLRGKHHIFLLSTLLDRIEGSSETPKRSFMDVCFKKYISSVPNSGIAIIISDFLVPKQIYEAGLNAFVDKNFELKLIQVLSDDEIDPNISGEFKLKDAETGEIKEVTVTEKVLERYKERLKIFCEELKSFCNKNSIVYAQANTKLNIEDFLLVELVKKEVIA